MNHTEFMQLFIHIKTREVYAYLLSALPITLPTNKFVIFTQGRTGSELLCDLINTHPDIHCDTEILRKIRVLFPLQYVYGRAARIQQNTYGFKVKPYQLTDDQKIDPHTFLTQLYNQQWKIIYLKRLNVLRQSLSMLIAIKRKNVWHLKSSQTVDSKKVNIDPNKLIQEIERHLKYLNLEKDILTDLPHLSLVYEADLLNRENHQKTLDGIFDYLGIDSVTVKTNFKKTIALPLSNYIENYEEIVHRIHQTPYAKFLADENQG